MTALTTTHASHHFAIRLTSRRPTEFIDITDRLERFVTGPVVFFGESRR